MPKKSAKEYRRKNVSNEKSTKKRGPLKCNRSGLNVKSNSVNSVKERGRKLDLQQKLRLQLH